MILLLNVIDYISLSMDTDSLTIVINYLSMVNGTESMFLGKLSSGVIDSLSMFV